MWKTTCRTYIDLFINLEIITIHNHLGSEKKTMNSKYEEQVRAASAHFEKLMYEQLERVERINAAGDFTDYAALDKIIIGICGGDGIGPNITRASMNVLEYLLADDVKSGRVEFRVIDGLTIENRIAHMKAIPDDVMEQLKQCHVILKGPTTTPHAGDALPNIESANVAMRKALDLFANVRPVKVPDQGIDWTFFRENTEGSYAVGSKGVNITDDLGVDFCVTTTEGTSRIARLAYEFARNNGKDRVSIVTKANIIKTTDGKFLGICREIAKEYPEITTDEWFVDIMTAKLVDVKRRRKHTYDQHGYQYSETHAVSLYFGHGFAEYFFVRYREDFGEFPYGIYIRQRFAGLPF